MDSGRFFCTSDFIGDAFCVVDILSTILRNDSQQKNELEPILLFFFKHLFTNQANQNVIKQPFLWFFCYYSYSFFLSYPVNQRNRRVSDVSDIVPTDSSFPSTICNHSPLNICVFSSFSSTICNPSPLNICVFVTLLLSVFMYWYLCICNPSPLNIYVFSFQCYNSSDQRIYAWKCVLISKTK